MALGQPTPGTTRRCNTATALIGMDEICSALLSRAPAPTRACRSRELTFPDMEGAFGERIWVRCLLILLRARVAAGKSRRARLALGIQESRAVGGKPPPMMHRLASHGIARSSPAAHEVVTRPVR